MDKQQQEFHKRLEGMAKNECVPQVNRNYLSDKFAKELRRARDASTKNSQKRCNLSPVPCTQILKSNIPGCDMYSSRGKDRPQCGGTSPEPVYGRSKLSPRDEPKSSNVARLTGFRSGNGRGASDGESDDDPSRRPPRRPLHSENIPPYEASNKNTFSKAAQNLEGLEEKVDCLNTQAQQLLKQLKREQTEREKVTELYEEATAELRRMREKERPATDMETRIRRLECERDEALAKVRTAQVDNEELKIKLDRTMEEASRDRQRWTDKASAFEHRLHTAESDRDELTRRHNRTLEVLAKMEQQQDEQKARITMLDDQKQEHLKQIENLGLFVKDLEQTTKQLHDKVDEKRHENHQAQERVTQLEDMLIKLDQHLSGEKDRFIQQQNDAYQAQVRNQEIRTEVKNIIRKKNSRMCD
ncbi:hypothetical protein RvY_10740 [Ramazzottius varieornatus]|uniref:Uncharacterized protein n=1 Tax=Ramazzottius varieornatus TaxID=947166 RepID=A0A1D1VFT3_RAMVA|nr:hypothetical protein RvY_10740 [Ramazzottius varieornatus]